MKYALNNTYPPFPPLLLFLKAIDKRRELMKAKAQEQRKEEEVNERERERKDYYYYY